MPVSHHPTSPPSITLLVPYDHPASLSADPDYKVYSFQPSLLIAPYFLGRFHEALHDSTQVIVLQQTTAEHFDVYEHWLLTSELLLTGAVGEAETEHPTKEQARAAYDRLLCCCSLACTLGDDVFLDALVTQLVQTLRLANNFQSQLVRLLTQNRIERIIAESGVHSGYFKLVAHAYARFATIDEIRILASSNYNVYFKSRVLQSMASMRKRQHIGGNAARDFVVGTCHYHTHGLYDACTQHGGRIPEKRIR